jgi:hypothetical protein
MNVVFVGDVGLIKGIQMDGFLAMPGTKQLEKVALEIFSVLADILLGIIGQDLANVGFR